MQNHVTPGTARRLRDAGFPQPEYKFGQYWRTEDGRHDAFCGSKSWATFEDWVKTKKISIVFAPTATDILRELGDGYRLCCLDWRGWIVEKEKYTSFEDQAYEYVAESYPITNDENPAEACAKAWLERNKTLSSQ